MPPSSFVPMGTMELIDHLQSTVAQQMDRVRQVKELPLEVLSERPAPERWSALEVIEHMNLSSGVYHRNLKRVYNDPKSRLRWKADYTPGAIGKWCAAGMQPKPDGRISWKMRTMGMFEPRTAHTQGKEAIHRFLAMQQDFHDMLEAARTRGLEGPRITSSLGPILKFKVGDAFQFPIAHQERHMLQLERTLDAVRGTTGASERLARSGNARTATA